MNERTRLDELFMSQALGRGMLSSVQIHRLMEEVKRRRMTKPSVFAHDVAVDLGLLTRDKALSLLRSDAVQQTLIGAGPDLERADLLLKTADEALYVAKEKGRNCVGTAAP